MTLLTNTAAIFSVGPCLTGALTCASHLIGDRVNAPRAIAASVLLGGIFTSVLLHCRPEELKYPDMTDRVISGVLLTGSSMFASVATSIGVDCLMARRR